MPGVAFYPIDTARLSFRSDGRWYADDEPVLHERLARMFSRYVRRKPVGGYEIWIDERHHADVEVEDTPFVVTALTADSLGNFTVVLNDGTTEPLAPASLRVGSGNVLYCRVKGGTEQARFLRPAYYQLADCIEEAAPGQFRLRCGGATYTIARR